MSIDVYVKIRAAVRLTDILSHTERSISALLQAPLAHRIASQRGELRGSRRAIL